MYMYTFNCGNSLLKGVNNSVNVFQQSVVCIIICHLILAHQISDSHSLLASYKTILTHHYKSTPCPNMKQI